ncbi:MAG: polyprenyl synthetase family protein [Rhodospirillales bacterium]|nr:polyprenyl synthetase family protein [Alphaproteobacteria bacterium]MCB9981772.1 polyprenyl synthetase family protein [Rhodospirillales bacterium]
MTQTAAKKPDASPLDELSALLDSDMRAVNAMILARMDSPVKLIPQLASYLIAAGGKRVRPLLTLATTAMYEGEMTRAHRLAASVEFIHTATLLHDDVVDESEQRRGQDAANLVFGNQASVLVGDFLFSRAFQLMTEDGSLDVLRILSDASAIIAQGEVMQLTTANNLGTTMDDYIEVIKAKTAALFAAACEVGPVIAGVSEKDARAMAAYGMNIGIAFQIADDALDYIAAREDLGKTIGDDFREGKMTAPVLFALQNANDEERAFWTRTMSNREINNDDFDRARTLIAKSGALDQCFDLAYSYRDKAIEMLHQAPAGKMRDILEALTDYMINRKS